MKMTRIKTETYALDDKWMVDIQTEDENYMAYLWHSKYGIKDLMFGSAIKQPSFPDFDYEEFLELVEANWEDYKEDYIEEYCDYEEDD